MNAKTKNVYIALICSMISSACGDNYFTDNELKERTQEIVYRVLNVLPINLQNMQAVQLSVVDSVLAKKEYTSSILSRSTVNVVIPNAIRLNPQYNPNGPTNTQEACISVGKVRGSGNLVSSTRISTAHHVIDGAVADETGAVKYTISFDGNDYAEMGDTKIENPLLSNRLYVYGLRNWVSATDQLAQDVRRLYLRQWKATLEEHFAKVDTTSLTIKGSDVAILNVLAKTVAYKPSDGAIAQEFHFHPKPTFDFPATPSGPFDMVRPGLFFDIAPHQTFVADTSTASCHTEPINNQDPMWALHNNYWPADFLRSRGGLSVVNLVSNPGYKDAYTKDTLCSKPTSPDSLAGKVCMKDISNQYVLGARQYNGCARTTLDGLPGSSGGGVLVVECSENGGKTNGIALKGVLSSANNVNQRDGVKPLTPNANWTDDVVPIAKEAGQAAFDAYTGVAMFTKEINGAAGKDLYFDPDKPKRPEQPVSDNPFEPGSVKTNSVYDTLPPDDNIYGLRPNEAPTTKPQTTSGTGSKTPKDYLLYQCKPGPNTDYRVRNGVALGVTGVSTHARINATDPNDPARVGALGVICGPWSSVPWSNNYLYLWVYGYTKSNAKLLDMTTGVYGLLYDYFINVAERRSEMSVSDESIFKDIFRPTSMQMCPPNYYLHGLDFTVKPNPITSPDGTVDNRPEVVGITSITCAMSRRRITAIKNLPDNGDWGNETERLAGTLKISLAHSKPKEYKWSTDLYFNLSQHIGNPYLINPPDVTSVSTSCGSVTTTSGVEYLPVTGILLETQTQGTFRGLQLQCAGNVP